MPKNKQPNSGLKQKGENNMTIYIYSNETNAQVDSHTADDNSACEQWANDKYGYEDYHWSYCDQPVSNA